MFLLSTSAFAVGNVPDDVISTATEARIRYLHPVQRQSGNGKTLMNVVKTWRF